MINWILFGFTAVVGMLLAVRMDRLRTRVVKAESNLEDITRSVMYCEYQVTLIPQIVADLKQVTDDMGIKFINEPAKRKLVKKNE